MNPPALGYHMIFATRCIRPVIHDNPVVTPEKPAIDPADADQAP